MLGRNLSGGKLPKPTFLTMPTNYELAMLRALQGKQMYQGTVTAKVKAVRRRLNRMAKASRKVNRGRR